MENLKKQLSKIFRIFSFRKTDVESVWQFFIYVAFSFLVILLAAHFLLFVVVNGIKDKNFSVENNTKQEPINEKAIKEIIGRYADREASYRFVDQEVRVIKDPSI